MDGSNFIIKRESSPTVSGNGFQDLSNAYGLISYEFPKFLGDQLL